MRLRRFVLPLLVAMTALVAPSTADAETAVELSFVPPNMHVHRFETSSPADTTSATVTGVTAGFVPVGIDVRPATGGVYMLALSLGVVADTTAIQIYTLDVDTGVATPLGSPATGLANAVSWGIDFNPVVDRIRVTSDLDTNLRFNPDTGALSGVDSTINGGKAHGLAYDHSVGGATLTTAFVIDGTNDDLLRLEGVDGSPSPNLGTLTKIADVAATTTVASFDISPETGTAYVLDGGSLKTLNLTTGVFTSVGTRPYANSIGFAVLPRSKFTVAGISSHEGEGVAGATITRSGSTAYASSVTVSTSSGTATSGVDFLATTTRVNFVAGQSTASIYIPLISDTLVEAIETFTVTLSSPEAPTELGTAASAEVPITSDDVADTTPPIVLLQTLAARTYAQISRYGEAAVWSCSERCTTKLTLRMGTTVVGTATKTLLTAGKTGTTVKLTTRGKSLLLKRLNAAKTHRQVLVLTLVSTDASGNKRVTRGAFTVRRR